MITGTELMQLNVYVKTLLMSSSHAQIYQIVINEAAPGIVKEHVFTS